MSLNDPQRAIKNAKNANKLRFSFGFTIESIIRPAIMNNCIKIIQLFLFPYFLRTGIEKLSIIGAQKNLRE